MNRPNKRDGTAVSLTSVDPNADFMYKQGKSNNQKIYSEPLIQREIQRYEFKFSSYEDLAGPKSICRVVTIILLVIASLFLPLAVLIDKQNGVKNWYVPWWAWLLYVIVVNTTFLMIFGAYIASTLAYPYSNSILVKRLRDQTNVRFGTEFRRCVERMTRMIKDMTERQSSERAGTIMEGKDDDETEIDLSDSKASVQFLSSKDIYMRVA